MTSLAYADTVEIVQLACALIGFATKYILIERHFTNLSYAIADKRSPEVIFLGKRAIRRSLLLLLLEFAYVVAGAYGVSHGPPYPSSYGMPAEPLSTQAAVNRIVFASGSILTTILIIGDFADSMVLSGWNGIERRHRSVRVVDRFLAFVVRLWYKLWV